MIIRLHAFNYFGAAQALVVPATSMSAGESRMHVIHVNPGDPLEELGAISQDMLLDSSRVEDWYYGYCTGFRRSVIMGEPEADTPYYVYAQSNVGIVVADIEEPDSLLASVPFSGIDPCASSPYQGWQYDILRFEDTPLGFYAEPGGAFLWMSITI